MSEFPKVSGLFPVEGIRVGTTCAGIKKTDRRDLVVFEIAEGASTAAVFTNNAFCAAPVIVAKQHRATHSPRYLLINTGNANAGTGEQGIKDAFSCCKTLSAEVNCKTEQVLPFSTGVIAEPIPVDKIQTAIPKAIEQLDENGWGDAAYGILTTDLVPKSCSRQINLVGETVTITGIAKGSGMIRPDMATMLAYIATDVSMKQDLLQQCLQSAVDYSFNRITVDGDTSTNDACVLMATGKSKVQIESAETDEYRIFSDALIEVCEDLAKAIVRDGEGATKFITIDVSGGKNESECKQVAYTVAHSPLVKTAFFASDPNWGRILAAVGRAGIENLNINEIEIFLGDVCVVRNGGRADDYTEERGQAVMSQTDIPIQIKLNRGNSQIQIWTCDFSYDYVKINAEYRT